VARVPALVDDHEHLGSDGVMVRRADDHPAAVVEADLLPHPRLLREAPADGFRTHDRSVFAVRAAGKRGKHARAGAPDCSWIRSPFIVRGWSPPSTASLGEG
jgi:hypothetical protein